MFKQLASGASSPCLAVFSNMLLLVTLASGQTCFTGPLDWGIENDPSAHHILADRMMRLATRPVPPSDDVIGATYSESGFASMATAPVTTGPTELTGPSPPMTVYGGYGTPNVGFAPAAMVSQGGAYGPLLSDGCVTGAACGIGTSRRFYASLEYLHWWTKGMLLRPLVTSSPDTVPVGQAGVLGYPDTEVVFGGRQESAIDNSGGRIRLGINLKRNPCNRLEFEYFLLDEAQLTYSRFAPSGGIILARPFFDTVAYAQDAELVGYPGIVDGQIDAVATTDFAGLGFWYRSNLMCSCGGGPCGSACAPSRCELLRLDAILGFRHLDLDETLYVREQLTSTDPLGPVPVGTTFDIQDRFRTENLFDGFDLGMEWEWGHGRWGVSSLVKMAFGRVRRRAFINGSTTVTEPLVAPTTYTGGLLALDPNIGWYSESDFTVVPEVGVNLHYMLTCNSRLKVGYTLIYLSDVWRAGGIVDNQIDSGLLPPPTVANAISPRFVAYEENFFAQGINLGLEFRF